MMNQTKNLFSTAFLLLVANAACAFDLFDVPKTYESNGSVLPVNYLQSLQIPNSKKILDAKTKSKVACLVLDAERVNQKKYSQTYYIKIDSPFVQLLNANFPAVRELTNL